MFHTRLLVVCDPAYSEILIAELAEAGFDTFLENGDGFEAFARGDEYDATLIERTFGHGQGTERQQSRNQKTEAGKGTAQT